MADSFPLKKGKKMTSEVKGKQEGLVLRKTEASQRVSCVFRMYKIVKEKRRKKQYEYFIGLTK